MFMYCTDYNDFFPYQHTQSGFPDGHWYKLLLPYIPQSDAPNKLWWCPDDVNNQHASDTWSVNNTPMKYNYAYGFISYGLNASMLWNSLGVKITQAKRSNIILFVESATSKTTSPRGYFYARQWHEDTGPSACTFHGKDANTAWLNGSVTSVRGPGSYSSILLSSKALYDRAAFGWNNSPQNKWNWNY